MGDGRRWEVWGGSLVRGLNGSLLLVADAA